MKLRVDFPELDELLLGLSLIHILWVTGIAGDV